MTDAEQREMDRLREENRDLRARLLEDEHRADDRRWRAIAPE